jgi:hypothetical protein
LAHDEHATTLIFATVAVLEGAPVVGCGDGGGGGGNSAGVVASGDGGLAEPFTFFAFPVTKRGCCFVVELIIYTCC